jgi:hypothetical protein
LAEAELADLGLDGIRGGGMAREADEAVLAIVEDGALIPEAVDVGLRDIVYDIGIYDVVGLTQNQSRRSLFIDSHI